MLPPSFRVALLVGWLTPIISSAQDVTPDGASTTAPANNAQNVVGFWIYNVMGFPQTMNLGCGYDGSVTSCWLVENTIYVGTDESAWVNVYYSTGSPGSGLVTLSASGPGGSDGGSYSVTVTAPPGVQVTPDGQTVFANGNAQNTQRFTVKNTGTTTYTFNLMATCSGGMSACAIVGGTTSVVLGPGIRRDFLVSYSAGAPGSTGTIGLNAWVGSTSDAGYVNVTSQYLTVNTDVNNNDNQSATSCAANCFDAVVAQSTPTYITLDDARGVTLVYRSDRVALRPFVYADVKLASGHPTPQRYWLEARINGVAVQFLNGPGADGANGEQRLYFSPPSPTSTTVRLAGQFDATPYATAGTGLYPMNIVVGVEYAGASPEERVTSTRLMIVDERRSQIARGWSVVGLQRAVAQADSSVVLTEGDGSALLFASCGPGCFTSPPGEYSTLSANGSGASLVYTRSFFDSARAIFNHLGQLTQYITRLNDTTTYGYYPDGSGRLWTINDPYRDRIKLCSGICFTGKAHIELGYNSNGLSVIREVLADFNAPNSQDRSTIVTVASDSTLRVVKDPDGDSTRFGYDSHRRLEMMTNRRGDTTRFSYDARSWKVTETVLARVNIDAGSGGTTSATPAATYRAWQIAGVPTSATSSVPASPVRPTDVIGRVTGPVGDSTTFTVDRWGAPLVITDPVGGVTTIQRENMLITQILLPWGATTTLTYVPGSALIASIQRTGQSTTYLEYDPFGQVKRTSGTGRATEELLRGIRGRVDSARVAGVIVARYYYDSRFRVDSVRDGAGHTTKYRYDSKTGNLDSTALIGGRYARRWFDHFGRDSVYKAVSQPTRRILYDVLNRVTRFHDGVNSDSTVLTYDPLFLLRVRDPKGQVFKREVNALGWTTREFDPADTSSLYESFRYDRNGRLTSRTNRRGLILTLKYDAVGRLISKRGDSTPVDSFWYSPDRRQVVGISAASRDEIYMSSSLWTDSAVTVIEGQRFRRYYKPSAVAQLDSANVSTTTGITFGARRFYWNPTHESLDSIRVAGQLVRFSRPDDRWEDTTRFPGIKRIDAHTSFHGPFQRKYDDGTAYPHAIETNLWRGYGADSMGRVRFVMQIYNNLHRQFHYDSLGRLRREDIDEVGGPASQCVSGQQAQDPVYAYGYICSPPGSGYDSTRLATHDAVANMLTWSMEPGSRSYDLGNRLISSAGVWTYTHDADGNLIRKVYNGSPFLDSRLKWSADGLLLGDSNAVTGEAYQYDYNAFGQLVRKRHNGFNARYFLWDGDQLLAELNSTATKRVAEYAYLPGVDNPLAVITGPLAISATRFFNSDALGNVTGIFSGIALHQQIHYNLWSGAVAWLSGTMGDTSRLRWKGLMWERGITTRYYVRNRWYDPDIGRFLSEDPIGIGGGLNQYVFANGDPINGSDPYGAWPWWAPHPPARPPLGCGADWQRTDRECYERPSLPSLKGNFDWAFGLGRVPDITGGTGAKILREGADIAVGSTPGVSTLHDLSTLLSGRNVVTGEEVGLGGRAIAFVGLTTPVGGGQIRIGIKAFKHVLRRHAWWSRRIYKDNPSKFVPGVSVPNLIWDASPVARVPGKYDGYERIVDAGHIIGIDNDAGGVFTSVYTVYTDALDNLRSIHPGRPRQH